MEAGTVLLQVNIFPSGPELCCSLTNYLHDDAGHDVFKWLLQLGEAGQAGLHHTVGPLVHLGVLHQKSSVNPLDQLVTTLPCNCCLRWSSLWLP